MTAQVAPASDDASRRWRSIWRLHFYSGMFAIPFLVMMAVTGLVVLYTQPIQSLLRNDIRHVNRGTKVVTFDQQALAAYARNPKATVTGLTVPNSATAPSIFSVDDGSSAGQQVFVNPYTEPRSRGPELSGCPTASMGS
jgi:uncharacterized iron-regulated membrane protein